MCYHSTFNKDGMDLHMSYTSVLVSIVCDFPSRVSPSDGGIHCLFYNFHEVFGHFAQITPQVGPIWEILPRIALSFKNK